VRTQGVFEFFRSGKQSRRNLHSFSQFQAADIDGRRLIGFVLLIFARQVVDKGHVLQADLEIFFPTALS